MKISDSLVDYLCALSKLEIKAEERETVKGELEKIIDYMDILGRVDISEAEAATGDFPAENVFRKDEVCPSASREDMLSNAPAAEAGCFCVPKTVE